MARDKLHIVTGAPGAGKSVALEALLALGTDRIVFDIDWLIGSASALTGQDVHFASEMWVSYNALWLEVVHAVHRNGKAAVLFAPFDVEDLARHDISAWCTQVRWLLLDCDDQTRRRRLAERRDWSDARTSAAIVDARKLRTQIADVVDTGSNSPIEVARAIQRWLQSSVDRFD